MSTGSLGVELGLSRIARTFLPATDFQSGTSILITHRANPPRHPRRNLPDIRPGEDLKPPKPNLTPQTLDFGDGYTAVVDSSGPTAYGQEGERKLCDLVVTGTGLRVASPQQLLEISAYATKNPLPPQTLPLVEDPLVRALTVAAGDGNIVVSLERRWHYVECPD